MIKKTIRVFPRVRYIPLTATDFQAGRNLSFNEDNHLSDLRQAWNALMQESFDKLQPLSFPQ